MQYIAGHRSRWRPETAEVIAMSEEPAATNAVTATPTTTENPAATTQNQLSMFEVWKEYEHTAVHFNDLIMKLRVQALGVVTAVATIAGIVLKEAGQIQWDMLSVAFLVLILFWLAVWVLDSWYYACLLYGAVDAIVELEKRSREHASGHPERIFLDLSTAIEKKVGSSERTWFRAVGPPMFYGLVLIILCLICFWTRLQANQGRPGAGVANPAKSPPTLLMPKGSTATLSLDKGTAFSLSADGQRLTIDAH